MRRVAGLARRPSPRLKYDPTDAALAALRARIDAVDAALVERLVERQVLAGAVGALKSAAGLPVVDDAREQAILGRVRALGAGRLPEPALDAIFREILTMTRAAARGPGAGTAPPAPQPRAPEPPAS